MVYLKNTFLVSIIILLSSCAKVSYLWHQGIGQLSLLNDSRENEAVLADPKINQKDKDKIKTIEELKSYFYTYWQTPEQDIYSQTHFLENDAVTYLLISSKYDEIKPKEHCFIFMGCFPYLGFFKKNHAKDWALELEKENYVTFIRPVYAYSSLGYFEDRILSSFFYYDKFGLSELIFHELFHTIFFIENEVDINESMANYFSEKMAITYLKLSNTEIEKRTNEESNQDRINKELVTLVGQLNDRYKAFSPLTKGKASKILKNFLKVDLRPKMRALCNKLKMDKCYPAEKKWNNASLAAFMTYEQNSDRLSLLHAKLGLPLKEFFHHIELMYKTYEDEEIDGPFSDYLFSPIL